MNILIYGIGGRMGKVLYDSLSNCDNARAVVGVDKFASTANFDIPVFTDINEIKDELKSSIDCIIDFSVRQAIFDIIPFAIVNKIPCVLATTGYNAEEQGIIDDAKKFIPIFQSGNMSVGINLIIKLAKQAASILGDTAEVEIIEQHHNQKIDAPSGTALMLAKGVSEVLNDSKFVYGRSGYTGKRDRKEIGIHAVRGGTIVGKHEVMFILNNEVVTIKHESESRSVLAVGAIKAALYLASKSAGLYNMDDLLNEVL